MSIFMRFSTFNGKHINTAMHSLLLAFIVLQSFCKTSGQGDCMLPVDSGMCSAGDPILRFYYDHIIGNCLPFAYYCDGNSNNFETIQQCQLACTGSSINACDCSPCQNDGLCVDNLAGGYCCVVTTACTSAPCLNGGACSVTSTGYSCSCPSGYTGTRCETVVTTACASAPCLNGGTCSLTSFGYSCTCPSGYTGTHCETSVCSLPLAAGTAATCPGAQVTLRYYYAGSTSGCTPFAYYCGANANNFESSALCEAACGGK
ncbi:fibropellin-3-like isoform X1 [Anneissia japonica]|uniref:fibropellin-3-like isoform X1 n=1 Tax=Anneissia japonica TaxID=1529436 RepID=UPI00142557F7|nr:fibropellin-3-like isoform X1 [Anneissia japonica]